ncbi:MAG: hypothetical protein ACRENQ_06125 [Gemmatimonadaceae bacterium]
MSDLHADAHTRWQEALTRREMDGVERVALLPTAHMVAVAPSVDADDPAYVFIEWTPDLVERATPGSAVWRAALDAYLASDGLHDDPHRDQLRMEITRSLVRFPSLDAWFRWRDFERRLVRELPEPTHPKLQWGHVRCPW